MNTHGRLLIQMSSFFCYLYALPEKPKLLALNKAFVNRSISVHLPGYQIVRRKYLDTDEANAHIDNPQSCQGIFLFASEELAELSENIFSYCNATAFLLCV